MVLTAVIWYKSVFTTAIIFAYAGALFFIGFKTRFGRDILMLLGAKPDEPLPRAIKTREFS